MKARKSTSFRLSHSISSAAALLLSHFAAPSALALTYYWDNNGVTSGFGTAAGTWAVPTTGSAIQGWSQDAAGLTLPVNLTTTTTDDIQFGTGTLGLLGGTITVTGTVDAASLTFDDNSGNMILSGGTINLAAAATINNGGNTNTISSSLSGAGTSLAFTGGGTLIFSSAASAAGFGTGANATVSGGTILRFSGGGHGALGGSTGFNINVGAAGSGGTLALGNSGTVANNITVVAGTGTRSISNSGSPSGTFSGTITANENLAVNNSGSNQINTSGTGSTIAATKTVTYTASSSGSMTNSAIFSGSGAIAYAGSNSGNITANGAKTYSGGTTLSTMSSTGAVIVGTSSNGPASAPTDGPFGTGTLSIAATKIRAGTTADITVGNTITFTGNPTFSTIASEKSLIFSGNAALGSTRTLTVETGSTVATEFVEFSGNISGAAFGITKAGTGVLRLSGGNSYSGATTLNAGKLVGVVGGNCSSTTVNLNNVAATLGVAVIDNTLNWTCSALTASAAGVLEFNFGAVAPSTTVSPLIVTGLSSFTVAPSVNVVVDSGLAIGTYPLMTWGSTSGTAPTKVTVSNVIPGTFASLSITGNTLNLVISSVVIKDDNNTFALSDGTSWVGGLAPSSSQVAMWNNTVTSPNTTALGANVTWSGITIENPGGPVTINAGHTLTLGAAFNDIDLSSAHTADLTLNCPLAMNGINRWYVAATRTLKIGGPVSGAFNITKLGTGTLQLGASNIIPDGVGSGNLSLTGTLDLNGNSETINGLSGTGIIDNTVVSTTTLTVGGNDQTSNFSGVIQDTTGTLNLTKIGTGDLTLSNANTLSGAITISGGTFVANNIAPLNNVTSITMADATTLRTNVDGAIINSPITLGAVGTTNTINASNFDGSGSTLVPFTLGGAISGAGNLTLSGIEATNSYGLIILNAASNYTGSTLITTASGFAGGAPANANIFVRLGVENALPTTTVVTLDGGDGGGTSGRFCELNLNGKNQTLAGLTNLSRPSRSQEVYNTNATASTLTINNTAPFSYSGKIGGQLGPAGANGDNLGLTKSGAGTFTLAGANTYTGNTTINAGTLELADNAQIKFVLGNTSGSNNTLTGAGTATLNGDFVIDTSAADSLASGSWTLENVTSLTGPYGSTFSVVGFTDAGSNKWTKPNGAKTYTFDETTGILTLSSGTYASWIAGFSVGLLNGFADDPDFDGIDNGVEMVLGGNPAAGMDSALMPTLELVTDPVSSPAIPAGNYLLFTYRRTTISEVALVASACETDTDLLAPWTPAVNAVSGVVIQEDLNFSFTPAAPANTDRVRVYVPRGVNTKLFGRLNVVVP